MTKKEVLESACNANKTKEVGTLVPSRLRQFPSKLDKWLVVLVVVDKIVIKLQSL